MVKAVKKDKNIPALVTEVSGQPSLEGLQCWRFDDGLRQLVPETYSPVSADPAVRPQVQRRLSSCIKSGCMKKCCGWDVDKGLCDHVRYHLPCSCAPLLKGFPSQVGDHV